MRRSLVLVLSIAAALLACNPAPASTPDMGGPGDSGAADSGPRVITLPGAMTGTMTSTSPAMLSCVGMRTMPTPGAAVTFNLNLLSFGEHGDHALNTNVCFCGGNAFTPQSLAAMSSGSCGTGCQFVTSDGTGHAMNVMGMANGWYAYRVFATNPPGPTAATTFLDSIQINEVTPGMSGATIDANAVSSLIAQAVAEAESIPRIAMTTTFAGRVQDCAGNNVQGAIVRAFHADGSEILDVGLLTAQQHFRFFTGDGSNPDSSATNTAVDGLYVVLNVPPSSPAELVRLEAWAYTGTDPMGTATMIGCEAVQAFPDGVSIVNIGPLRNDYASTHPCHH